jgi:hypothetical protein
MYNEIRHQTCGYSFGFNSFMVPTRGGCWQRLHVLMERRQQKTREGDRRSKDVYKLHIGLPTSSCVDKRSQTCQYSMRLLYLLQACETARWKSTSYSPGGSLIGTRHVQHPTCICLIEQSSNICQVPG